MQTPDVSLEVRTPSAAGILRGGSRRSLAALALTLMLVLLWSVTHRYKGLTGDAELYAFQAMARIQSGLGNDLFLRYGSQDSFTIFSPLYQWCIGRLGLLNAALILTLLCKAWLFAAAWALARSRSGANAAFLAVALLIIVDGIYGGFSVFRYAEDWLTARSLAEALGICALALHFYGYRVSSLLAAGIGFLVHPIMALPALLVLLCLWCSLRIGLITAAAGVFAALALSLWALHAHTDAGLLAVIDAPWLEVVRERSVFLFPQHWSGNDWENNARPFLCLALAAAALRDPDIRLLSSAGMLVGAAGLAVACIAGAVGHVAIFIQAQAWRWMWVTCFLSVLFVAPAALVMYRDRRCGPLAALLLVAGWIFSPVPGGLCVALALLLWLLRERIDTRAAIYLHMAAAALGLTMVAWSALKSWSIAGASITAAGDATSAVGRMRDILGLQVPAFMVTLLVIYVIGRSRSRIMLILACLSLGVGSALALPAALRIRMRDGDPQAIRDFADWRAVIPPGSTVYVAPAHNSAAFAWFTLQRPNYLSVDQSAGVVFSRATAMEVERRSGVLLPLRDPDWRLLTSSSSTPGNRNISGSGNAMANGTASAAAKGTAAGPRARPLTRERLASVCRDPQLNFVVAREKVGFDPLPHRHRDDWQNWNLYDCARVRAAEAFHKPIPGIEEN